MLFMADGGTHGRELWRSDGRAAGTVMVEDINPVGDSHRESYADSFESMGARLYLRASDGTHGSEVWRSDGTPAGTEMVTDINKGGGFRVASRAQAQVDPRNGTVRLKVRVRGAGHLVVEPGRRGRFVVVNEHLRSAGRTKIVLEPTTKGMRQLERALREAQREGREVGRLRVKARFTFTPCGGEPSSQTRRYVLKLR